MTLKLSTFLLPTNEFALIAEFDADSGVPHRPSAIEGLEEFGRRCGAVDVLVVNYPTRVEDAIVTLEVANRADEKPFKPGDELVKQHIEEGHDFSPADLVKLTDEEKAVRAAELIGETPEEYAEAVRREQATWDARDELFAVGDILTSQVEQLPGPIGSPEVLAADESFVYEGDLSQVEFHRLPYVPQLGETVAVAVEGSVYGTEHLNGKPLLGQELSVVGSPYIAEHGPAEGDEVIWLDTNPAGQGEIVVRTADILPLSAV